MTDKCDIKRHAALGSHKNYQIWDFVFLQGDGSKICLNPNFYDTRITSYECDAISPSVRRIGINFAHH